MRKALVNKLLTQQSWRKRLATLVISGLLSLSLWGCAGRSQRVRLVELPELPTGTEVRRLRGAISEVAPPAIFLDLAALSTQYQPQVDIAYPKPNQVIDTDALEVKLKLKGLPIYKDKDLGLGPHLQIVLDNQPPRSVYSLSEGVKFEQLSPGSHTLRVVAVTPWGESFKNEAAYAQTTFHVFAATGENTPDSEQPLLTYLEPQGSYGAQPILLDFYLNNAPLHQVAQASSSDDIVDWQIRCSVNGQSFIFDQWEPLYLKGLTPGQNWIQLTLIDREGNPIKNAFNNTVHTLTYDPSARDSLSKLVRGELPLEKVGQIVDKSYEPPVVDVSPPSQTDRLNDTETAKEAEAAERSEVFKQAEIEGTQAFDNEAFDEEETTKPKAEPTVGLSGDDNEEYVKDGRETNQSNKAKPNKKEGSKSNLDQETASEKVSSQNNVNGLTSIEDPTVEGADIAPNTPPKQNGDAETTPTMSSEEEERIEEPSNPISDITAEKKPPIEDEKSPVGKIFQKFERFFGSAVSNPEDSKIDEETPKIIGPTEKATNQRDKSTEKRLPEAVSVETDIKAANDDASGLIEPLSTEDDSDTVDSGELNSFEPETTESLSIGTPSTIEPSTVDDTTASETNEPTLPVLESTPTETSTSVTVDESTKDERATDESTKLRRAKDSSLFSQWGNQVKAFFQKPASSGSPDKSSDRLSIEELPVIIEEQTEIEQTEMEPEAKPETASQDSLESSGIESSVPEDRQSSDDTVTSDDRAVDSEGQIDTDELLDLELEDIKPEDDSLEDIVIPETLSSPGIPSENVMAPLEP